MLLKHVHRSVDSLNSLKRTIITKQLIKGTERVLLSISGGQDSMCLLFLMNQLYTQMNLDLSLFWCHHLWQINSFSLMRQITKISFLFQFDGCFAITPKLVPSEMLARNWRHNCSYRICLFYNYSKIILAHSANDKVETILLNLLRGTGVAGLSPLSLISASSVVKKEHTFSCSVFPMFLFSSSPFCIDLLTLHGIKSKNIKKKDKRQAITVFINKTRYITQDCKKDVFSNLKKRKIASFTKKYPFFVISSFRSLRDKTTTHYKNGTLYVKFLEFKDPSKIPYIMLTPQMTTFFHRALPLTPVEPWYCMNFGDKIKTTHFFVHSFLQTIEHLQHICPIFLLPFFKKHVPWISEKVFFRKEKKILFGDSWNFDQTLKQRLRVKSCKYKIIDKNRVFSTKLFHLGEQDLCQKTKSKEKRNTKWFVFVSFTFFKSCYTSLQQTQIQKYNKKTLFHIIKSSSLRDTCFIDSANTNVTTRYFRDINYFLFSYYQYSKSQRNKLKKLPWKKKNTFFLFAFKQLKINVFQDTLFLNFVTDKQVTLNN